MEKERETISVIPPPPSSSEDQLRRLKADLKEIVPVDLYETNIRASALATDLAVADRNKSLRHATEFFQSFHIIFREVKRFLSEGTKDNITKWMNDPQLSSTPSQKKGIDLFYELYDEMSRQGIGELFESPITPPIGNILGKISDLDVDLDPLSLEEELGEGYYTPGDIHNIIGDPNV